jgi:hypothetical protein
MGIVRQTGEIGKKNRHATRIPLYVPLSPVLPYFVQLGVDGLESLEFVRTTETFLEPVPRNSESFGINENFLEGLDRLVNSPK